MLRNNYPITRLIGTVVVLFSIALFSVFYQNALRSVELGSSMMNLGKLRFYVLISTVFITGIGLFFQKKWARILSTIFLIMVILGGLFIGVSSQLSGRIDFSVIAVAIFIIAFGIVFIFLLYNKKLNDEFDEKVVEELDDTLDSQLFRESDSAS
jgi:predicted ferric reductase